MTRLDDLLDPLSQGIWEVEIPKASVTEPLDAGWIRSRINVPSPGTIASFRKGRFHVHETRTGWRVHLDRYDPKRNPLLHLIDDAPLVLMISDTFMTLIMDTRRVDNESMAETLATQRFIWQEQVVYGLLLLIVGLFILNNPVRIFKNIFELLLPLAILCIAGMIFIRTIRAGLPRMYKARDLLSGIIIFCAGILAFLLPMDYWMTGILAVLTVWMLASASMLLFRVTKGKSAVPEGFYSRLATGIISLILTILLHISPAGVFVLLMEVLGAITILLGVTLCVNGMRLRTWIRQTPSQ
ncbi:hypothetical protein [Methanoregula sp.]|uniref:hypothetical protein n=1 Tax=Methanoregula sp. TaxID=2052170 RepID=UPI00356B07B2